MFKLCRKKINTENISTYKQFKSQASQTFFIKESLTPLRSKRFYELRHMKKKFPSVINFRRSSSGNVLAFVKENDSLSTENSSGEGKTTLIQSSPDESKTLFRQSLARENLRRAVLNSKSDLGKFVSQTLGSHLDEIHIRY